MSGKEIVYICLAVLGLCSTWYFNINFMMENGSDIRDFVMALGANDATKSISVDIAIAGTAFLFWSYHEAKKLDMKNWWIYPVVSGCIAIAFGAPLFLLMRERQLKKAKAG